MYRVLNPCEVGGRHVTRGYASHARQHDTNSIHYLTLFVNKKGGRFSLPNLKDWVPKPRILMKTRMTLILAILTVFSIVNMSDALTLIKESGDNQTRWENSSLTEPIVFRVDVTNDPAPNLITIEDAGGIIDEIQIGTNARYQPAATETLVTLSDVATQDVRRRLQVGRNIVKVYCTLGTANKYTLNIYEGNNVNGNRLAVFTAYAIQTAQAVATYKIDVSASTASPQIVYDDALGYYYLGIKVVDANSAPQGFVSVIFSLDGSGHLVDSGNKLVSSLNLSTDANGVAEVEYRPGGRTGKITAHIRYTHERYTVTYFYRDIRLKLVSGDAQVDYFGTKLPNPLAVKVEDGNGRAVSDQNVTFEITSPSTTGSEREARLFSAHSQTPSYRLTVPTNSSGVADVTLQLADRLSNAVTAVTHTIVARMDGARDVVFRATATVPVPDRLKLISGDNQIGNIGTTLNEPFKVKVIDTKGSNVANQAVTFVITEGGGSLSITNPITDSDGIAQTYLRLGSTVGTTTIEARLGNLTPVTFTARVPVPDRLKLISGDNQTGDIGTTLDEPFKVKVIDTSGDNVVNQTVRFVITQGRGSLSTANPKTDSDGIAQTYLRLGNTVGTTTVEARLDNLTPVTFTASSESAPSRITLISGNNQTAYRNVQTDDPLRVQVTDINRNGIADVNVKFSITRGSGNLSDANVKTDADGYAEIHLTPTSKESMRVEATAAGLNTTVRFTVNVRIAPTRLIQISGDNQTGELNRRLAQPFVVEVRDDLGDPVSGTAIHFEVIVGGGRLSATTARSNTEGRAQSYLILGNTGGKHQVAASVAGISVPVTFTANSTTRVFLTPANRPPIYWLDTDDRISQLVDTEVEPFRENARNVTCLTIAQEKVYWGEQLRNDAGRLRRANLDGTSVQEIRSLTSIPRGIAVDTEDGKVYWTNSKGRIHRVNIDGTGFQSLITQLNDPTHIVLNVTDQQFYWSESGRIRRANFDGSSRQVVAITSNPVSGIAVASGKIYWTEAISAARGNIRQANLNGSSAEVLVKLRSVPVGIAVDPSKRKLYWTNSRGRIQRSNLNGSFIQNIVEGLGMPSTIAISVDTPTPPKPTENYADSDVNKDGVVDTIDLRLVANALGESPPSNRRTDVDRDGTVGLSDLLIVINNLESQAAPSAPTAVSETALLPNYPNPFNPETWIPYQLREAANLQINIYSAEGILIRRLSLGYQPSGYYITRHRAAHWDGKNENGEGVASGIYFYELVIDGTPFPVLQKMLIVK